MKDVSLSKTNYCKLVQCEKIIWLMKYKPDEKVQKTSDSIFATGAEVGEIARSIFGDFENVEFSRDRSKMVGQTEELLSKKTKVITEASFEYEKKFCSVDILQVEDDGVIINEVKCSTTAKEIYLDDVSFQYFILTSLGFIVKKVNLVHLNKKYIRYGELELDKLFTFEDLTDIAISKQDEIKENIEKINKYMEEYDSSKEPKKELGIQCFEPYKCEFWEYCTKDLPYPNVFDIAGLWKTKKINFYKDGKVAYEDLIGENLKPDELEQVDFDLNNREPKINVDAIKDFIKDVKYPLYFLDYESINPAIPQYDGTHAYQQLCFQYSLHILEKPDGELLHKEFLAEVDDTNFVRHLAENLIKDIPAGGTVIVFNKKFENTRNIEMAKMFPDLADELLRINSEILDIMVPFENRDYYTKEMQGSYSIKQVLPALYPDDPELDYHYLDGIKKGDEASSAFLKMKNLSKEEQEKLRYELLKYCGLDTLAMVKIWEKFIEVIGE